MNQDRNTREYKGPRPYTYHYDGALFDGPDQYVNIMLSSDGVLQSEVLEDDEENVPGEMEEDSDQINIPSSKTSSLDSPVVPAETASYSRQPSYSSEPKGYIQVTHTTKNKQDARVTVSRSVPEFLETLPSLDEAVIQPVACESEIYDKWARLPRAEPDSSRSSVRPITVTAKGWTILQSMQNPPQSNSSTMPIKNNPALTALADEECNTLDSIIDHYNQMLLVESGSATSSVLKPSQLDVKRLNEDDSEIKVFNKSGRKSPHILNPLVKKVTTNSTSLNIPDSSIHNVSPLPTKKALHQPIPAATASIDWPPDLNQSDKFYQMARFWSWRPSKTSVKFQKSSKSSPNQLEKLERNQKSSKKEKINARVNTKKSGPSSDTMTTNRPTAAAASGRNNQLATYVNDNNEDTTSPSRSRFLNLKSTSYNAMGDASQSMARNYNSSSTEGSRGGATNDNSHAQKNSEHFLRMEYDGGKIRPSPSQRTNNKSTKQASVLATKTALQSRYRPKLTRTTDIGDSRSIGQRSTQNDGDVPQVQFLDLNELNLGQTSRLNHRQKNQNEDFRTLTFSIRGKSSDPKSMI